MSLYLELSPQQRLEAISRLLDEPGWKLFIEIAEMARQQAMNAMLGSKTGDETMLHKGAFKAIDSLISWPVREAEATKAMLEAPKDPQ